MYFEIMILRFEVVDSLLPVGGQYVSRRSGQTLIYLLSNSVSKAFTVEASKWSCGHNTHICPKARIELCVRDIALSG